ncbi:hypothetical protein RMATCC62417_12056 [Rhizopus microsporus]|nr:hypothetical protein RMATCC62417_12056 [Rhizopus microsporus]
MIANFLMPYLPATTDSHSVAQQLPFFFLMANSLFQRTGYIKFIEKLVPMTSPTRLLALQINVPQICSLFSSSMNIHDLNGDVITSRQIATESKDAVFSSFFDIDKINSLCASYGLKFAHNIHALPGLKTVRINGYLRNQAPSRIAIPFSHIRSIKRNYEAFEREMPDRRMIQQAEVDALQRQLKKINSERREFMLRNNIRDLKRRWIRTSRDAINERLINTKQQLSDARRKLYNSINQTTSYGSNNNQLPRVENFKLDDTQSDLTNFAFSGTDNGLVTMTETAKLSLDQFKFHLKLYNRYSALTENTTRFQASAEEAAFFKFAKPFKLHASDIAYGSGAIKLRAKLQRTKKTKAKVISEIEAKLRECSFQEIRSIEELNNWYNGRITHQDVLRDFYYSRQGIRQLRTYELQKRKYIDRLCSQEQSYVTSNSKKPSIMFMGDSGLCFGSSIKGYQRYGGYWKPIKYSLYTSVCITSEYNTSQTCIFCFKKLLHPKRSTTNKNGRINLKNVNSAFVYVNPSCPSVKADQNTHARDTLSAVAVGLSGMATLLLGTTFPQFNRNISSSQTDQFNQLAAAFCTGNAVEPITAGYNT